MMEQDNSPLSKNLNLMSNEEVVQEKLVAMDEFFEKVCSSPETARAFLQRAGILDNKGNLAEYYQDSNQ